MMGSKKKRTLFKYGVKALRVDSAVKGCAITQTDVQKRQIPSNQGLARLAHNSPTVSL